MAHNHIIGSVLGTAVGDAVGLPAGTGLATLRAILRLWVGISPTRSGVFSAGNGPAMRSAIIGAAIDELAVLRELVSASTRITHTVPLGDRAVAWVQTAVAGLLAIAAGPLTDAHAWDRLELS